MENTSNDIMTLMSVEFEERGINRKGMGSYQKLSFGTRLLMKTGLAKDEQGANRILFISACALFLIAVFIAYTGLKSDAPSRKQSPSQEAMIKFGK
jgi:hypothetical protein